MVDHLHMALTAALSLGNHVTLWCYALGVTLIPAGKNDAELMGLLTSLVV